MLKSFFGGASKRGPRLSIVVILHRMPHQAERTLLSMSPGYQQGVTADDYEIIVVENASDLYLGEARALALAPNLRYFYREETQRSPVPAVNFGVAQALAPQVAIVIDGARMASPGVVRLTLAALAAMPQAAVSVPGYHLGQELQQVAVNKGHDEAADTALLKSIGWPADGYRLFEISVWSGSCRQGFLRPHSESNFLALSKDKWDALGGLDARYDDYGGGKANLDLYGRLLGMPDTPLVLLFGEGTFHQVHGGVTTNSKSAEREAIMAAINEQDRHIRGDVRPPRVMPVLFGAAHPAVHRFMRESLDLAG